MSVHSIWAFAYIIALIIGRIVIMMLRKKEKLTWKIFFLVCFAVVIIPITIFIITEGFNPLGILIIAIVPVLSVPISFAMSVGNPQDVPFSKKDRKTDAPENSASAVDKTGKVASHEDGLD